MGFRGAAAIARVAAALTETENARGGGCALLGNVRGGVDAAWALGGGRRRGIELAAQRGEGEIMQVRVGATSRA